MKPLAPVPLDSTDDRGHRRRIADVVNALAARSPLEVNWQQGTATLNGMFLLGTNAIVGNGAGAIQVYITSPYTSNHGISTQPAASVNYAPAIFYDNTGTAIGSITCTPTTTAFNTTSDETLKMNIVPAPDAGGLIDQIEVVSFDWNTNGEHVEHGFLAQNLADVVPSAVTPGDSAEQIESKAQLNASCRLSGIKSEVAVMPWMIDKANLIPLLVKEMQSLRARVTALEGSQ